MPLVRLRKALFPDVPEDVCLGSEYSTPLRKTLRADFSYATSKYLHEKKRIGERLALTIVQVLDC